MGDILQVLGIGRELAKELPGTLDLSKRLLGKVFLLARFEQLMGPEDPSHRVMATGKVELPTEPLGTEAGLPA